jgi:hypothetical protein
MRFEGRELKSYAEPVSANDLVEREVYFTVQFADQKLLIPMIEPIVFVGKNLGEGDTDVLYFQNFESHATGVRYASATNESMTDFQVRGPDEIKHFFTYDHALDELMKCSLRRRGR